MFRRPIRLLTSAATLSVAAWECRRPLRRRTVLTGRRLAGSRALRQRLLFQLSQLRLLPFDFDQLRVGQHRSEERRVGKESRDEWTPGNSKNRDKLVERNSE